MTKSNKAVVPEAMESLEKFKYEVANNGNISARDAGRIGGNMVKKMVEHYENQIANK